MLTEAILWKYPNADFDVSNEKITAWRSISPRQPSEETLRLIVAEYEAHQSRESYKELRAAEYPPIKDQLDAIWKGGQEMESMRQTIQFIKSKYPKPETVR